MFVFPEGDSRSNQSFRRNRQFGNNRGFTWGASNTNNNNNNNNRRRFPTQNDIRPTEDLNDVLIFDQNDGVGQQNSNPGREFFTSTTQRTPTSTVAIPGMGTTRSACEDACLTTPEYNPVCGNDGITYFSKARLRCAQKCGKSMMIWFACKNFFIYLFLVIGVGVLHIGACPRMP